MALPSYTQFSLSPEFGALPADQKRKVTENYWNQFAAENPDQAETATQLGATALSFVDADTGLADAAPIQRRAKEEQRKDALLQLASYEGVRAGELAPEDAQAALERRQENRPQVEKVYSEEGDEFFKNLTALGQGTDMFGSQQLENRRNDLFGASDVSERNKQYEESRNLAAQQFGISPEDVDDVVKHNLNAQEKSVSRDALGRVHFKNDLLFKPKEEIENSIRQSDLPTAYKDAEINRLDERLDTFKSSTVDNIKKNFPDYAEFVGFDGKDDFSKIEDTVIGGNTENLTTGAVNSLRKSGVGLFNLLNKLPGSREDRSNLFASVADAVDKSRKIDEAQLAISRDFDNQKLQLFGVDSATLGAGLASAGESAALAYATGGLVPTLSGSGRIIAGANAALRTAPVATVFGTRQGMETYDQALKKGIDEKEALKLGITAGLIEGGLTTAFSSVGLGGLESAAAGGAREVAKKSVSNTIKALGKDIVGEELEENAINALDQAFVQTKLNPNLTVDDFKNSVYETTIATLLPSAGVSALRSIAPSPTYEQTTEQLEAQANAVVGENVDAGIDRPALEQQIADLPPGTPERAALEDQLADAPIENVVTEPESTTITPVDELPTQNQETTAPSLTGLESERLESPSGELEANQSVVVNETPVSEPQTDLSVTNEQQPNPPSLPPVGVEQTTPTGETAETAVEQPTYKVGDSAFEKTDLPTGTVVSGESDNYIKTEDGWVYENSPDERAPTPLKESKIVSLPTTNVISESPTPEAVALPISEPASNATVPDEAPVVPVVQSPLADPVVNPQVTVSQPTKVISPEEETIMRSTNASLDRSLKQFGLPPVSSRAPGKLREWWNQAVVEVNKNPTKGVKLSQELVSKPRGINEIELNVLAYTRATQEVQAKKTNAEIIAAYAAGNTVLADSLNTRLAGELSDIQETATAIKIGTSTAGKVQRAAQVGVDDQYDIVSMQNRFQGEINVGKPLTPAENKIIRDLNARIEQAEEDGRVAVVETEARVRAEMEKYYTDLLVREAKPKPQRARKSNTEKVADLKRRAQEAQTRLNDRFKRRVEGGQAFSTGITEEDISDVAIIAVSYLQAGAINLQDFTNRLVEKFGDTVVEFSDRIFEESKALLNAAGVNKTPEQLLAEIDPSKEPNRQVIWNMAKAYAGNGMKASELVDQVHKDLKTKWKGITRDMVTDLINNYGQTIRPTRSALQQELVDLKRYAALTKRIEDLKAGKPAVVRKREKAVVSDEIRQLEEEAKELLKATKVVVPKDGLASAKARLQKDIDALNSAVQNNELIQKPQRTSQTDAELEALKAQRDQARKDYDEAFPEYGPLLENKERQILELQEAVRKNEMLPENEKNPVVKTELDERLKQAKKEYKDFFKENGPKLTAKERKFLELQEALDKNILLPNTPKNKRQKTELDERISDLKKQYKEQFREQGTQLTPNQEIDRVVKALDKQIDREEKGIVRDLKDFSWFSPEIAERRRILDAKREARNEIRWRENAEKTAQAAITRAEEIIRTGKLPAPKGRKERTPTQNLQVLWDTRNELQSVVSQMRRDAAAEPRALKAVNDSIKELELRIAEKDFSTKPRKAVSPEVAALREARKELQKTFSRMKKPLKTAEDRTVDAINKRTAQIRENISKGNFSKEVKPTKVETDRIQKARIEEFKAKEEWNHLFFENNLKKASYRDKFIRGVSQPIEFMRTWKTMLDLPPIFRQGGMVAFSNPDIAFKALPKAFVAGVKAGFGNDTAVKKAEMDIRDNPQFELFNAAGLAITQSGPFASLKNQEEEFRGTLIKKIPILKNAAQYSEANYVTFLNDLRMNLASQMGNYITRSGSAPSLAEAKVIASYVNNATGRGNLGALEGAANAFSAVFFSPRYWASRLNFLAGGVRATFDVTTGFRFVGSDVVRARKAVAREYAKVMIGYGLFYSSIIMAAQGLGLDDDEFSIEWNPISSDFGKIKIGKTRIDPLGGLAGHITFLSRAASFHNKTLDGKVYFLPEAKGNQANYLGIIMNYGRSKLAPFYGSWINVAMGKDVVSKKATLRSEIVGTMIPLSANDVAENLEEFGAAGGIGLSFFNLMGAGTSTYDDGLTWAQRGAVALGDDASTFLPKKTTKKRRLSLR